MIIIEKGSSADTEAFIELLANVKRAMPVKEWLYLDTPDEVREMMEEGAISLWLAKDGKQVVGAFSIIYPKLESYNYGYLIDMKEDELLKVINMDTAAVLPSYRGLRLQQRMMEAAEKEIRREEGTHYLMCTVHPENNFSLNNVLNQGYSICKTVELYGSVRHVLIKKIGI